MNPYLALPEESKLEFNQPIPLTVHFDRDLIETTKHKLQLARYPVEQTDFGKDNWSQGAKVASVKELAEYWRNTYDWAKNEVRMPLYRRPPKI